MTNNKEIFLENTIKDNIDWVNFNIDKKTRQRDLRLYEMDFLARRQTEYIAMLLPSKGKPKEPEPMKYIISRLNGKDLYKEERNALYSDIEGYNPETGKLERTKEEIDMEEAFFKSLED